MKIIARRRPASAKPRGAPEAKLQMTVRRYLEYALPADIMWTASLTGVFLSPQARAKAKAMGVRRGWPDLSFMFPDGVTRFIELKADGSLSPEQRDFRDLSRPHGVWALCRSVEGVEAVLISWGVKLKASTGGHPDLLSSADWAA